MGKHGSATSREIGCCSGMVTFWNLEDYRHSLPDLVRDGAWPFWAKVTTSGGGESVIHYSVLCTNYIVCTNHQYADFSHQPHHQPPSAIGHHRNLNLILIPHPSKHLSSPDGRHPIFIQTYPHFNFNSSHAVPFTFRIFS